MKIPTQIEHKAVVFYHANCKDGLTSAWVIDQTLNRGKNAEFIALPHYNTHDVLLEHLNKLDKNTDVLFVDITPPFELFEVLVDTSRPKSLTILDHHPSARDAVEKIAGLKGTNANIIFNDEHGMAGTTLTATMLNPKLLEDPRYWFLQAIADIDLGAVHTNPIDSDITKISALIDNQPGYDRLEFFRFLDKMLEISREETIAVGAELLQRDIRISNRALSVVKGIPGPGIDGRETEIPILHVRPFMLYDIGKDKMFPRTLWPVFYDMFPEAPVVLVAVDRDDGKGSISIRKNPHQAEPFANLDLSTHSVRLWEHFGGKELNAGGRHDAAAMHFSAPEWEHILDKRIATHSKILNELSGTVKGFNLANFMRPDVQDDLPSSSLGK